MPNKTKPVISTPPAKSWVPYDPLYWTFRHTLIAVSWTAVVASVGIGYYFFVFIPVQEQQRQAEVRQEQLMTERIEQAKLDQEKARQLRSEQRQETDRQESQTMLDNCLRAAEQNYVAVWDKECVTAGLPPDCRLPNSAAADLNTYFKDTKDECFKRYPQEAGANPQTL